MTGFSDLPIIIPNKGLAQIPLASTLASVLELLGTPTETLVLEEELLNSKHQVLRYEALGLDLYFNEHANLQLSSIDCTNTKVQLNEVLLFQENEKSIIALLKNMGFALSDSENHSWGEKRLEFESAGLEFYFERGKLTLVHIE